MGAGIAASPHCAERRICRYSWAWSTSAFRPSLTRSRSWLTSSGDAFHRTAPSCEEPDRPTRLRRPRRGGDHAGLSTVPARRLGPKSLEAKTVQCSAALLGSPPLASRFAHRPSEDHQEPRRARRRQLFRRLFPAGPDKNRSSSHCLPAEIGPLVTCRILVPLPALGEAGTAVPITPEPCTSPPSRQSEKWADDPVDNGDIGHNCRNLLKNTCEDEPGFSSRPRILC
jgi:hypothetical protein